MIKKIRNSVLLLTLLYITAVQQTVAQETSPIFHVGEELVYKVTFLGITLGSITIKTIDTAEFGNKKAYIVKGEISSSPGIPFASIHQILESNINQNARYVFKAVANKLEEKQDWSYIQLICNYDKFNLNIQKWFKNQKEIEKDVHTNKPINDGLGLFFFARSMSGESKSVKIPTFMGMDTATTLIEFTGKTENIKIDAIDRKIRTKLIKGTAQWKGPYGLNGTFDGWFSDDEARVPIKAKMKVFIGSVNIELVSWKRTGWQLPKVE